MFRKRFAQRILKSPGGIAQIAGCSNALFICKVIHLDSNSGWGRLSTLPCCDYTNSLLVEWGQLDPLLQN
jgi:hypothetical protein